jgi:hypothetical protein
MCQDFLQSSLSLQATQQATTSKPLLHVTTVGACKAKLPETSVKTSASLVPAKSTADAKIRILQSMYQVESATCFLSRLLRIHIEKL